jgi:hypothetical protein
LRPRIGRASTNSEEKRVSVVVVSRSIICGCALTSIRSLNSSAGCMMTFRFVMRAALISTSARITVA